jgi:hypothetical protein
MVYELGRDTARNQHIRATRVMERNVENHPIKEIEESGKSPADQWVGAGNSPAQDYIAPVTCIPELPEIPGIALAIGVETEEILGLKHVHAIADSPRVTLPLVAEI